ncbi:MAG TPA: tetratricopeptide repeat protein [Thermoanaerobaculia bacterium]|jgi:tetratricopeptide (TPR) repeat protein|nr:tetratricopeptide repeat protein [Thermoanaerobaculia bacterium]
MQKTVLISLLLSLLIAVPLFGDAAKLINEGVALYDTGRFDEAIAKFKEALVEDPSSDRAAYELALTYQAKGDPAQCQAVLEPRVKKKNQYLSAMYGILGNCYDIGGDAKRAIATYRKGLKVDANDTQLLFNLAVTQARTGQHDEARKLLKKELTINPKHSSGHYLLGVVFEAQGFRTAATLSYLRFLSLEPAGERAKDAAKRALALLGAGVEVKDKTNVNINIDPNSRKEEGDFGAVEMMMAIAGAAQTLEKNENKSEFEKKRAHVSSTLKMITEGNERSSDYTSRQVIPFFRTLYDQKLIDTYAGMALLSLRLPGTEEWRAANEASIQAYVQHFAGAK